MGRGGWLFGNDAASTRLPQGVATLAGIAASAQRRLRFRQPLCLINRFFPGGHASPGLAGSRSAESEPGEARVCYKIRELRPQGWRRPTSREQSSAPCASSAWGTCAPAVGGPPWGVRAAPVQGSANKSPLTRCSASGVSKRCLAKFCAFIASWRESIVSVQSLIL